MIQSSNMKLKTLTGYKKELKAYQKEINIKFHYKNRRVSKTQKNWTKGLRTLKLVIIKTINVTRWTLIKSRIKVGNRKEKL